MSAIESTGSAPGVEVEVTLGRLRVAHDVTVDELHDVEGPSVHRLVLAQTEGDGHGDRGRAQGA